MLLHDVSDIFLEGAKLFNYAYGDGESIWTDVFFGCFAVVFGVSRLIYFPFYVLWVISYVRSKPPPQPRICSRTLLGYSDPPPPPHQRFSRGRQSATSIDADGRSSDDVIAS